MLLAELLVYCSLKLYLLWYVYLCVIDWVWWEGTEERDYLCNQEYSWHPVSDVCLFTFLLWSVHYVVRCQSSFWCLIIQCVTQGHDVCTVMLTRTGHARTRTKTRTKPTRTRTRTRTRLARTKTRTKPTRTRTRTRTRLARTKTRTWRTRTWLTVTYCKLQLNLQSLSSNNNEHKVKIHNMTVKPITLNK